MHSNARPVPESRRRIPLAAAEAELLKHVCKHAGVPLVRKFELFICTLAIMLSYATASAWLLKAYVRRLDGSRCNCLRRISRIPHTLVSRRERLAPRKAQGTF